MLPWYEIRVEDNKAEDNKADVLMGIIGPNNPKCERSTVCPFDIFRTQSGG